MHGIIALDIDGTITPNSRDHTMPMVVIKYLTEIINKGWQIIFITGRSFKAAHRVLQHLPFPYYLAVQNGAILLEMPAKRIVAKKYLDRSIFTQMEAICHDDPSDFVIYAGFEHKDECYYRPKHFSTQLNEYLIKRIDCFQETWHAIDSFDEMPLIEFPSIKCFGRLESATKLAKKIEDVLGLHVPLIHDPFDEEHYVVQGTHPLINKGQALKDMLAVVGRPGKVIAAGDDYNDCPMLAVADIKIAMANAPKELLVMADIIAPPATEHGIMMALEQAMKQ